VSEDFNEYQIDVDLTDVDTSFEPLPSGPCVVSVGSITRKQKAEAGSFPYYEVILHPVSAPGRQLWLNLSLNPKAHFNIAGFLDAVGLPRRGANLLDARDKQLVVNLTIKPSTKNPEQKINEVTPPYTPAR
jgi:hypothetical protein